MDEPGNIVAKRRGLLGRWLDGLCTIRAAILIPAIFLFVPVLLIWFEKSSFSHGPGWQINGYYISKSFAYAELLLCILWSISILALFGRYRFKHAMFRLLASPAIFFALMMIGMILGSTATPVSDEPIASVYSDSRDKYYILAYKATFQDTLYQILSAERSLWNPTWHVETECRVLRYPDDRSSPSDPRVFLSGDESLLVVGRFGHLTDCIDLKTGKNLVEQVDNWGLDREQQWKDRTAVIRKLLAEHDVAPNSDPPGGEAHSTPAVARTVVSICPTFH